MPESIRSFSDQIRDAIDASGLSRYRICKEIGVAESTMSKFMNGKGGLSLECLDRLAEVIGMKIVFKPDRQRRKDG